MDIQLSKATTLNNIERAVKLLKSSIIYIKPTGDVIGLGSGLLSIDYIQMLDGIKVPTGGIPLVFDCLEFKNYMKSLPDEAEYGTISCNNKYFDDKDNKLVSYVYMQHRLDSIIDSLSKNIDSRYPDIFIEDVVAMNDFSNVLKSKSSDGAIKVNINGYIMYLFKGLLPINSSDSVNLKIVSTGPLSFVGVFNIKKKQVISIRQYINFIKL